MTFHRTIGSFAILCAVVLAGCATAETPSADPEVTVDATPESYPVAPEPTEELVPEQVMPTPLFELGCEEVVPIDRVIELYGMDMVALDTQLTGISSALLLTSAALADGALWCSWAPPGEEFAAMTFTASVATADEYAVGYDGYDLYTRPTPPLPLLDGARADCTEYYPDGSLVLECGWSVFFDGVWIVAQFDDLPASEVVEPEVRENSDGSGNPITANPDGLAARILIDAASALAPSALARPSQPDPMVSCDDLADSEASRSLFGAPMSVANTGTVEAEDLGSTTEWMGGLLTVLGVERQGWTDCLFVFATEPWIYVTITFAPSAAWILESTPYTYEEWVDLPSGDGVSQCTSDEGGSACGVALRQGDDLLVINADGTSDVVSVERFARIVAVAIDELVS